MSDLSDWSDFPETAQAAGVTCGLRYGVAPGSAILGADYLPATSSMPLRMACSLTGMRWW